MIELASPATFIKAAHHLQLYDPILGEVIARAPLPQFTPHKKYYEELVGSIISQQLSVKAAATILKRFKELFTTEFPTPEDIETVALNNHWHPYESVASWYVWHSLDNKPAL